MKRSLVGYVEKEWGREEWIANTEKYCSKLLHILPGFQCSIHYHKKKTETFYVQFGQVKIIFTDMDGVETWSDFLNEGDVVDIPVGTPHRFMVSPSMADSAMIIETSTEHFEEDSYRLSPSGPLSELDCNEHFECSIEGQPTIL